MTQSQLLLSKSSNVEYEDRTIVRLNSLTVSSCRTAVPFPMWQTEFRTNWVPCNWKWPDIPCELQTYHHAIFTSLGFKESLLRSYVHIWQQCSEDYCTRVQAAAQGTLCRWDMPATALLGFLSTHLQWFILCVAVLYLWASANGFDLCRHHISKPQLWFLA
jgi:hypothetical protein